MPVYTKTFTSNENKTLTEFIVPVIEGTEEILIKGDYHPRAVKDKDINHRLIFLILNSKKYFFFAFLRANK